MATTDQQMQLKDAMARAKQIAAKLNKQATPDESRKRSLGDGAPSFAEEKPMDEPQVKRPMMGGVDHTDPKIIAQQVANSLVQRAGLGSMLVEEVKIPNKLVGLVIGRGGEMINKLQSESGAKIQVAPDPPPDMADYVHERQITITGMSDAVQRAKDLIDEIRSEGKVPDRLLAGSGGPGECSIEMQIPAAKVGLVIGKGGETIKSLQERAGCKMVLFQDGEHANAPEKPLRISGEQSKVNYGQQLVQDLLTSKELEAMGQDKFPNQNRDVNSHQGGGSYDEVQVPRDAVGFVIGTKGASINMIQQNTGCKVQFKNDMEGDFKVAMLSGTPQQVSMAKAKLNEILQSHRDRRNGGGGGQGWGGPRPPFNGGWNNQGGNYGNRGWGGQGPRQWGPGSRGSNSLPPGHKHMLINVPANKCGLVIGKGGETLKFIHQDSKVNIEINREIPQDSPFRVFHVKGTDEQIDKALTIIRDKINDQSLVAKPADSQGGGSGQAPWGGNQSGPGGWANNQNQWNQQNQWSGQASWGGQPQSEQWGQWNQQQGNWNQQQSGWNPQQQNQPPQQQSQQPWDQQNQQNQWGQQYQWPNAQSTASSTTTPGSTPATSQAGTAQPATGQQDYSAAWALYYQQQQQYYQQYGMQQPPAGGGQPPASTGAAATASSTTTPAAAGNQSQAMADYQAKLAEYYKAFGQQPPQQQPQQQQPPAPQ